MNWENLTAIEFEEARKQCDGVCVIPIGVLERHGSHLPLGTDVFTTWKLANLVAEKVPVMVFPQYYFGQIPEATHEPGTLSISLDLMIQLLDNVCEEIHRNGFNKIILFSGHGGNTFWKFFLARQLEKRRDYVVYYYFTLGDAAAAAVSDKICREKGGWGEHAGGLETATSLHLFPELCKMEKALSEAQGIPRQEHAKHFEGSGVSSPIDWYAGHPTHIDGYHGRVDAEDGRKIVEAIVNDTAIAFEKIKNERLSLPLLKEFYDRSGK